MRFRLSARGRRDLEAILKYSFEKYGRDAADRYGLLLTAAMEEIGEQPFLLGSRPLARRPGVRVYSVSHMRLRMPKEQRVRNPVHQIVYRLPADQAVEILAIVGDNYPAYATA